MNIILYILVIVISVLLAIFPTLKKFQALLGLCIQNKRYDLLKKIARDVVSYINQISLIEDMKSDEKKQLAAITATSIAQTFGIKKPNTLDTISVLIESILWDEEEPADDDEDDDISCYYLNMRL